MISLPSTKLPITLAVCMIVLLVALAVGWVLLSTFGALSDSQSAGVYWTLLTVGAALFVLVLIGTVMYMLLTIKAIRLNQRQSNFIDSVTHELKTPIASLALYLQTLNLRNVSPQEQRDFLRFMLHDVERLDHLINHLLDTARLEKNEGAESEHIELESLLKDCVATVCMRCRVAPETVATRFEPCVVHAPRMDLELVFQNLIDNAVRYAGTPPRITLELRPAPDRRAIVRLANNGRSIPRNMRRKIFRRFVRLGSELERNTPGTGLGLYIARSVVRRLGGRIRVLDPREGSGAVFEVELPSEPPTATVLAQPAGHPRRVSWQ